ncbi:hypothetical protein HAX54_019421, partial [Datura stramonium]|nr:hypothetical protein [Datura stramonium]
DFRRESNDRKYQCSGYMSPEYAIQGIYSEKSDVFSFGVILLEIISSKKKQQLLSLRRLSQPLYNNTAWQLWNEGKILEFPDPKVAGSLDSPTQVVRCIHVGLQVGLHFTYHMAYPNQSYALLR